MPCSRLFAGSCRCWAATHFLLSSLGRHLILFTSAVECEERLGRLGICKIPGSSTRVA
jgi:hypothetical protein